MPRVPAKGLTAGVNMSWKTHLKINSLAQMLLVLKIKLLAFSLRSFICISEGGRHTVRVQPRLVTRPRSHSWFHLFDAMNRHQRFPDDKAICPHPAPSWLPSIMSTTLLFEHQAPDRQPRRIANTLFSFQLLALRLHLGAPRVRERK